MNLRPLLIALAIGLFILSFVPLFIDPYEHKIGVDFWTWANREVSELISGERQ